MTDASWLRTPGEGRYVRREREARFLLGGVPDGAVAPRAIEDRYLDGTTLRLRRVSDGDLEVYKLTQKIRAVADDPAAVALTNIYLTRSEYDVLASLPAHPLHKTRREWTVTGRSWAVDEFTDRWTGLVLAEVETDDDIEMQPPLCLDVSHDDRFSGGALAHADDAAVVAVMSWVRDVVGRCS